MELLVFLEKIKGFMIFPLPPYIILATIIVTTVTIMKSLKNDRRQGSSGISS